MRTTAAAVWSINPNLSKSPEEVARERVLLERINDLRRSSEVIRRARLDLQREEIVIRGQKFNSPYTAVEFLNGLSK